MRRRPAVSVVVSVLVAGMITVIGLVGTSGVSGAMRAPKQKQFYLSLGDSYSVGFQPGMGATAGYTSVVAKKAKMQLENFGCGGATTSSILTATGCLESGFGPVAAFDAVPYPTTTQEQAALNFIGAPANHGLIGLITISIGGNDVTSCANAANALSCVSAADTLITTNVTKLVKDLDAALTANGDTNAKIIGLTYPDVILGSYVFPVVPPSSSSVSLAQLSVAGFDALINPTFKAAYTSVPEGSFVNVTQAPYKKATTGDDTPLTTTTKLKPYGTIPDAVWEICRLTYFCALGNIHANTKGYDFIGKLVIADLATL